MELTPDERFLMMLYSPGTRPGLIDALIRMKSCLEADEIELFTLTETVLSKLEAMTDEAFSELDLYDDLL